MTDLSMPPIFLPTYDFDGNILSPQTSIYFKNVETGEIVEVASHEVDQHPEIYYDTSKYIFPDDDPEFTFQNARDFFRYEQHPGPNGLIKDTQHAIKETLFAPSFPIFKKLALIEANLFALLTARGHGGDNIQRSVELISEETLSDDEKKDQKEYIKQKYHPLIKKYNIANKDLVKRFFADIPSYMGVSNKNFCKMHKIDRYDKTANKKVAAIKKHYDRATELCSQIYQGNLQFAKGFSDDSYANILAMAKYYLEDSKYSHDIYRLYFSGIKSQRQKLKEELLTLNDNNTIDFSGQKDIMKISISK